jgi:hypothetical protein
MQGCAAAGSTAGVRRATAQDGLAWIDLVAFLKPKPGSLGLLNLRVTDQSLDLSLKPARKAETKSPESVDPAFGSVLPHAR